MRILFVTNEIPYPPTNGVRIAVYNPMRLMRDAGHTLALAVLSDEDDSIDSRLEHMRQICDSVAYHLLPRKNRWLLACQTLLLDKLFFMERYRSSLFARALRCLVSDFAPAVVHFDSIAMTQYRYVIPHGIGTIASINDSCSLAFETMISRKLAGRMGWYRVFQLRQIRRYESTAYTQFHFCQTMTEVDGDYLRKLNPHTHCLAIPNGVDNQLFDVSPPMSMRDVLCVTSGARNQLELLGQFVESGWRIVHATHPDALLHVRGTIGQQFEGVDTPMFARIVGGVRFYGFVESLKDVYRDASVVVLLQDQDCGIVNKALEAMACQRLVVGYRRTFRSISGAQEGIHYLAGENCREIGEIIADMLGDPDRIERIGMQARELIMRDYLWEDRSSRYEDMYQEAQRLACEEVSDKGS